MEVQTLTDKDEIATNIDRENKNVTSMTAFRQ